MAEGRNLEVDNTQDDNSSVFSDDYQSELTSLRSSIMDYRYENGRRYHAYRAGSYWYGCYFQRPGGSILTD